MDHFIHTGKAVDKVLGKGAVAVITDEVLVALVPTIVNDVPNCITLKIHDSQGCCDVYPEMPKRHQKELIEELEEEGESFIYLTMPMCYRSRAEAWGTAAEMLELLAKTARVQQGIARHAETKPGWGDP